jgi:cytidylate kinase
MSFAPSSPSAPIPGPPPAGHGIVVAVDGPSGSGKSSVSKGVARRLGLRYLDTGAQYRAITYWMLQNKVDVADPAAVAEAAGEPVLLAGTDPARPAISVDGVDASVEIRTVEVTAAVSAVSAVPAVRRRLVAAQRAIIAEALAGGRPGIVVEGRDIAAVVAPDATAKIFLTASEEARAQRRNSEHGGVSGTVSATRDALVRRDSADAKTNVLDAAPGATVVDATELTLHQVIDRVCDIVRAAGSRSPAAESEGVGQ